eukprot:9653435-Alexandrium_andersonii.AAC.1
MADVLSARARDWNGTRAKSPRVSEPLTHAFSLACPGGELDSVQQNGSVNAPAPLSSIRV